MATSAQQDQKEEKDEKEQKYISVDQLNFNLHKNEIQETKKIYTIQCDGLSNKEEQKDLWKTLTVARKNKIPLLTLVIDSFTRDRMDYYIQYKKALQLQQWSIRYPTLKILSKQKKHQEMIQAAAQTFFTRYSTMMQLPVMEKYDDSIESFTDYIIEATSLINTIIDRDMISPPFQIDLVIIPERVIDCNQDDDDTSNNNNNNNKNKTDSDSDYDEFDDDDESDSDSDDDDNDDDNDDDDHHNNKYNPFKQITDIKTKLDCKNIIYQHRILSHGYRPRLFHDIFKDLKSRYKENNKQNNKQTKHNHYGFPHGERLCIILDRRKGSKLNEIFMYKPDIFYEMPAQHVTEWYFQSSFKSIIPGKQQNDTITAKTSAKGYVFCLSFQIEQKDLIKCYLYTRSTMIRFLPDDIHGLLPFLFIVKQNDENYKFIQNEKQSRAKTQNIKLIDTQFAKFRAETQKSISKKIKSSQ